MVKYIPSIVAVIVMVLGMFAGPVQGFMSDHPAAVSIIAGLGAILAHLSPQPQK